MKIIHTIKMESDIPGPLKNYKDLRLQLRLGIKVWGFRIKSIGVGIRMKG